MSTIPLNKLHPVARKKILESLRRYTIEERLFALVLATMLRQLDEEDLRLKYVQKNLTSLRKINRASAYVPEVIEASNKIWGDTFKELTLNVSIAVFANYFTLKNKKFCKKIGVNYKDLQKLNRNHNIEGYTMATIKVVNLMLQKISEEAKRVNNDKREA